jgi:hypothetical protein
MSPPPVPNAFDPERNGKLGEDLDRLWAELPRLRALDADGGLVDHVAALRFLLHYGPDRPLLAGLVGGASCGKSTVFSSLVGRRVSQVHYQPHSSLGPVVWLHRRCRTSVLPESAPRRFFAELDAEEAPQGASVAGAVGKVFLAFHDEAAWQHLALVDLPDISSESARREGWLVRRLLPWLDLVIWVVDPNDYLFEDLYIDLIDEVAASGQRSIVIVNDIHGQATEHSDVLADRVARFRPDGSFILPRLDCSPREPYPLFRAEPSFLRLREFLHNHRTPRPLAPLAARVRHEVAAALHANAEWHRLARDLAAACDRLTARHRKRILASAPLLSVLPQPAQQELEHLRSRFSLWYQGKKLYQTISSPVRTFGRAAVQNLQLSIEDLDTGPLYRHLVGSLKEFGVDLHRAYLESSYVERLQQHDPAAEVLGSFDPEKLDFQSRLDAVARHLFTGAQQLLSDPSLVGDRRFQFVAGTTGVALVFFLVGSTLAMPGVSLLVAKGVAASVGLLGPELARYLPLDRMSRLAWEARDMLAAVLGDQMQTMLQFYNDPRGRYVAAGDRLLPLLEAVAAAK